VSDGEHSLSIQECPVRRRRLSTLLTGLAVSAPLALLGSHAAAAPDEAKPYDFDGDGHPDLVVGAPNLSGAVPSGGAGGVVVLRASASGVATTGTVITLDSPGVPGTAESSDSFGAALTSADYDGDGYADLAVGEPGKSVDGHNSSGAVTVLYGSAKGLSTSRSVSLNLSGGAVDYARLGTALASADLDDDGHPDLAVGAPSFEPEGEGGSATGRSVGRVVVFRGGSARLSAARSSVLADVDPASVPGNIQLGAALAVADLNRDGADDLVVGSTGVADRGDGYPGSVSVCFGAEGGSRGCTQIAQATRYAGLTSLAVGQVSGSVGTPEIAVGVTSEEDPAGSVYLFELVDGTPSRVKKVRHLTQASKGVPGGSEYGDRFGSSVAIGDLDEDGYGDLVVGAPGEDEGRGRVTVVRGADSGWRTRGNKAYDQDTRGIPGVAEPYDGFGAAVTLQDNDADDRLDLTVGAPRENESGAITTLRGTRSGLTTQGSRTFGLGSVGYPYPDSASFGETLGG
jgi:hypothetical protein